MQSLRRREILSRLYRYRRRGRERVIFIVEAFFKPVDAFQQGFEDVCLGTAFFGDCVCFIYYLLISGIPWVFWRT